MKFNDKEYDAAKSVNLIEYLLANGVPLVRHTADSVKLRDHDSLIIKDDNRWYWNSRQRKGNTAISFLIAYCSEENFKNIDANNTVSIIKELASFKGVEVSEEMLSKKKPLLREKKEFKLPKAADDNKRVIAYLSKERHIDYEIINYCIKHKHLYQEKEFGNCIFVGRDENGVAKFAHKRGTYDKQGKKAFRIDVEGSDFNYAFCFGGKPDCETVYVFEAAIDAMSHATLSKMLYAEEWKENYRLSLDGVCETALDYFLKTHPKVNTIVLSLDNDEAGRRNIFGGIDKKTGAETRSLKAKYELEGYKVLVNLPPESENVGFKDMNELLKKVCEKKIENFEIEAE